ncbi:MAG: HAD family hydrolase, partial [Candidatus Neomarinimicrobiota bacterium]
NTVLNQHGLPPHPVDAYRHFIGRGVVHLCERATGLSLADPLAQAVAKAFRDEYRRRWRDHTRLYPGISELLDRLTGAAVRMAVLTNKPPPYAELNRELFLSRWTLDPFWGAGEERPLKPAPDGLLDILDRWQLPKHQAVYVGDTDTDVETARAAGVFAVGAAWGFRGRKELESSGADLVADTPAQLWTLLRPRLAN